MGYYLNMRTAPLTAIDWTTTTRLNQPKESYPQDLFEARTYPIHLAKTTKAQINRTRFFDFFAKHFRDSFFEGDDGNFYLDYSLGINSEKLGSNENIARQSEAGKSLYLSPKELNAICKYLQQDEPNIFFSQVQILENNDQILKERIEQANINSLTKTELERDLGPVEEEFNQALQGLESGVNPITCFLRALYNNPRLHFTEFTIEDQKRIADVINSFNLAELIPLNQIYAQYLKANSASNPIEAFKSLIKLAQDKVKTSKGAAVISIGETHDFHNPVRAELSRLFPLLKDSYVLGLELPSNKTAEDLASPSSEEEVSELLHEIKALLSKLQERYPDLYSFCTNLSQADGIRFHKNQGMQEVRATIQAAQEAGMEVFAFDSPELHMKSRAIALLMSIIEDETDSLSPDQRYKAMEFMDQEWQQVLQARNIYSAELIAEKQAKGKHLITWHGNEHLVNFRAPETTIPHLLTEQKIANATVAVDHPQSQGLTSFSTILNSIDPEAKQSRIILEPGYPLERYTQHIKGNGFDAYWTFPSSNA